MIKAEVEVGGVYRVRWHDGSFTNVEILGVRLGREIRQRHYPYAVTGRRRSFTARNLKTGRIVEIKSAAKLRERVG